MQELSSIAGADWNASLTFYHLLALKFTLLSSNCSTNLSTIDHIVRDQAVKQ